MPKGYHHLTDWERWQIWTLNQSGKTNAEGAVRPPPFGDQP